MSDSTGFFGRRLRGNGLTDRLNYFGTKIGVAKRKKIGAEKDF
jgi:hypothetical protein